MDDVANFKLFPGLGTVLEGLMPAPISLTLSEASFVVGRSKVAINRAVDRGLIRAKLQQTGKSRLRKLGAAELRFLAISGEVERDLTPLARRKVYAAIRRLPARAQQVDLGVVQLALADVDRRIEDRLRLLGTIKALVEEDDRSDPVLRGTDIPVHAVAALARHQGVDTVVEDYPGLTAAQVAAAVDFARIYPRLGRPLPSRSFKRMLSDLAASRTWNVEDDATPPVPHLVP